jgi:hypothetical protein
MNASENSPELVRHTFVFNPCSNGGEQLSLVSTIHPDGKYDQELTLQSYGNAASFILCDTKFSPSTLRDLAYQLEIFHLKNKHLINNQ